MAEKHEHDHEHDHDHDHDHGATALAPDVKVADAGPALKTVRVKVGAEKVKSEYEGTLRELSRNAVVPGFRKGHVPRVRLLKQYGKDLANDVKGKLLMRSFDEGMKAQDLEAVGEPVFGPEAATALVGDGSSGEGEKASHASRHEQAVTKSSRPTLSQIALFNVFSLPRYSVSSTRGSITPTSSTLMAMSLSTVIVVAKGFISSRFGSGT